MKSSLPFAGQLYIVNKQSRLQSYWSTSSLQRCKVFLGNGGVLVKGVVVDPLTGLPLANPLLDFFQLGLQPLGALTPFPNSVESGETSDNDVPYTFRLAYDATDRTNVYVQHTT